MRIQDLREAKYRRPFEPFEIHLAEAATSPSAIPTARVGGPGLRPGATRSFPGGSGK